VECEEVGMGWGWNAGSGLEADLFSAGRGFVANGGEATARVEAKGSAGWRLIEAERFRGVCNFS
jgi:hypothetical protein